MNSIYRNKTTKVLKTKLKKQEKYFKDRVFNFTVESLIPYQYSADLLNFLELLLKKILSV